MNDLDRLLEEAHATAAQREQMRQLFKASSPAQFRPVALDPTILQSLDLRNATVLKRDGDASLPSPIRESDHSPRLGRYTDLGSLGIGGMGEVRRVRDPDLNRRLAMKIIHSDLLKVDATSSRFIEEAQVVAQLQHPNIIPIHELGRLEDGRLYFTMKEVQGRPLSDLIQAVHSASTDFAWSPTEDGWTFRRLMNVFSQVCAATAFAHSRGVIHRDLKPENILIGQFDEVLVVDWGIAKIVDQLRGVQSNSGGEIRSQRDSAHRTRMGEVAGTPAYMAPEQARGQIDRIDARTDIYALGAILYEILSGRCPYGGSTSEQVLSKVILGPPLSVRTTVLSTERITGTIELDFFDDVIEQPDPATPEALQEHNEQGLKLPEELVAICEKAMQRQSEARHQSASALQQEILDWIDGANKRDQALSVVDQSETLSAEIQTLETQVRVLREQAKEAQTGKPAWATADELADGWSLDDQAAEVELESRLLATRIEQLLQSALTHSADLEEAHAALLQIYRERHATAESTQQRGRMAEAQMAMEFHSVQLPSDHPNRVQAEAYLKGTGRLSLKTESPAAVYCAQFETVDRRQRLAPEILLGHTPLVELPLEMGSYVLRISQEGCHDVTYPIRIDRQGHWAGLTPEGDQPNIHLPELGSLAQDECFVAAGPFLCGRDAGVPEGLPAAEVWVDDFVIKRFHVTYAEYQTYLQALVDAQRHGAAEAALPVRDAAASGSSGKSCFVVTESGRVELVEDESGTLPGLQWPIGFVNFRQAVNYAAWLSESTGQKWRILNEFEWEKAARGVDARLYPWGNSFTPSWCNMELSREQKSPIDVDSCPVDCSVYGVRGMGGNIAQWTSSEWDPKLQVGGYQTVPDQTPAETENVLRAFRGGCWMLPDVFSRVSNRIGFHETDGVAHVGFRVGRDIL